MPKWHSNSAPIIFNSKSDHLCKSSFRKAWQSLVQLYVEQYNVWKTIFLNYCDNILCTRNRAGNCKRRWAGAHNQATELCRGSFLWVLFEIFHLSFVNKLILQFSAKQTCDKCDELEVKVGALVEQFKDELDAVTVKAFNSQLVRLYSPSKEPALVFFRHGIPLLYEGPVDADYISHHFNEFKEPTVRELTDETFEHLTQATSGSTTGDWFIQL